MKSLTKQQKERKGSLVQKLNRLADDVNNAVDDLNDAIAKKNAAVEAALDNYNVTIAEVSVFCEEITSGQKKYIDDRSEKWLDSAAGQNYQSWISDWQGFDTSNIRIELPVEPEVPDLDGGERLEQMPDEV